MLRCILAAATLFFVFPTAPVLAAGPSFDCAKASRQIDKAICARETVGALDGEMAAAYRAALAEQPDEDERSLVVEGHKRWLAARDEQCALDAVKPDPGSEEGLSPKEFGQLLCLQDMYGSQIAHLKDMILPLVPVSVTRLPTEPLSTAYPGEDEPGGYQAQFSPDKALMALGVEDGAGYIKQVWLYQPASGQLVVASPRTHKGAAEKPEDISGLNTWLWGDDGRFYVLANRPLGEDGMFGADMEGYAEVKPPADVAEKLAAYKAAGQAVRYDSEIPEEERLPGFNDDSYDEQEGGAFTAWAQNKGHGSFDLLAARAGDEQPRLIASGGGELRDFLFDPSGTRLFYNGEEGLVVTDPATSITRRLKGTHGKSPGNKPINISADGEILVYSATGACTRDAGEDEDQDTGEDDGSKHICLATLPPVSEAASKAGTDNVSTKADAVAAGDPWVGRWEGSRGGGNLSARIRRGTAKPDYLVIDLVTGVPGCSGAVTLYGKPKDRAVIGESYDPNDSSAPVCRVELSLDKKGMLTAEEVGSCTYYHGASCGFEGTMRQGE